MKDSIPLSEAQVGIDYSIETILSTGAERRRMLDLGFINGAIVHVKRKSPLGDPIAYRIRETLIALRIEDASLIMVKQL